MKEYRCPLVSVVVPAYQAALYIRETIESVQRQSVTNWELIVVDDASDDKTAEIVENMAETDSRIRLVSNKVNLGVADTRNIGLELSRGKYIALLDCDDFWAPDKLKKQIQQAEMTNADIIYCSYRLTSETGQMGNKFCVPAHTDYDHMLIESVISCSTALLRKETVGKYRFSNQYYHEDYVYWLQILRDGHTAAGIQEVLAFYRQVEASRSANKLKCAWYRWEIYRNYLSLSLVKSGVVFCRYAWRGFKKYRRMKGEAMG